MTRECFRVALLLVAWPCMASLQARAQPAVAKKTSPPGEMKVVPPLASEEDFRARWTKGSGIVAYDARARAVLVVVDIEGFDLSPELANPGVYRIKAIYDKGQLSILVNGRATPYPAFVLHETNINPLQLTIETNRRGNFRISNVSIDAEPEKPDADK